MKQYVLILLTVFFFSSCVAQKKEIIFYCNKLEGTNTNIRDLINIDGNYPGIMFFDDGSFVFNVLFQADATENLISENMSAYLHSWIDDKGMMQWSDYWGAYRIEGDTIIAHVVQPGIFWRGWEFNEFRYKIIDRNTIKAFYFSVSPTAGSGERINHTYKFAPCDSLPHENNLLKKYKWFWRNESDWKVYMEKVKQIKKQYKKK